MPTFKRLNSLMVPSSPPPGNQSAFERWSLVYFTRPGNSVVLRALVEDSPLIAASVAKSPEKRFETGATSLDWFSRRIRNQRINNRKVSHRCRVLSSSMYSISFARALKHGWRVEALNQIRQSSDNVMHTLLPSSLNHDYKLLSQPYHNLYEVMLHWFRVLYYNVL